MAVPEEISRCSGVDAVEARGAYSMYTDKRLDTVNGAALDQYVDMARARTQPSSGAIERFAQGIEPVDKLDPWAKVLIYGDNGTGKTRFAASAPKVLIIDVREKGTRSTVGSNAHKREVSTFDEIGLAYWYLKSGSHPYRTVAIDTVTMMHAAAMEKVMQEAEERDPAREKSQPSQQIYGRAGKLCEAMFFAFRNLPMHVVFLAQQRKVKDESGSIIEVTADLPDGCRGALCDIVGITGVMRRRKVAGKWGDELFTGDSKVYKTDECTNELKPITRNPTMPYIIKAWNRRLTDAQ